MKAEQKLYETDPEFMERFEHFAYEEVVKEEGQFLSAVRAGLYMPQNLPRTMQQLPASPARQTAKKN